MIDLVTLAEHLRDRGMSLAETAEALTTPDFAEAAYQAIVRVARRQATVHVDDVLAECPIMPSHPNAFGAVWLRAIRAGIIERSGQYRPSRDPTKHKHQYPIYRTAIFGT